MPEKIVYTLNVQVTGGPKLPAWIKHTHPLNYSSRIADQLGMRRLKS